MSLNTFLTVPMPFTSSNICLVTRSSNCVLVAVFFAGLSSEVAATTTFLSASVIIEVSIETGLELLGTRF